MKKRLLFVSLFLISILFISSCTEFGPGKFPSKRLLQSENYEGRSGEGPECEWAGSIDYLEPGKGYIFKFKEDINGFYYNLNNDEYKLEFFEELHSGSNLISVPFVNNAGENFTLEQAFGVYGPVYNVIGESKASILINSNWIGSVDYLDPLSSYWVKLSEDQIIYITGMQLSDSLSYDVHEGNNFISYPGKFTKSLEEVIPSSFWNRIEAIMSEGAATTCLPNQPDQYWQYNEDDLSVLIYFLASSNRDYNSPLELGTQIWSGDNENKRLERWFCSDCGFEGDLPELVANLEELEVLNLENNQITGPIPDSIGALSELQSLDLANNQLSGAIPESIGEMEDLHTLKLYNNQITGPIPESIGNLHGTLLTLYLNSNLLSGPIPSTDDFCDMWNNQYFGFNLNNNSLCPEEDSYPGYGYPSCIFDDYFTPFYFEATQNCE